MKRYSLPGFLRAAVGSACLFPLAAQAQSPSPLSSPADALKSSAPPAVPPSPTPAAEAPKPGPAAVTTAAGAPMKVKVVVLAMFEVGNPTGDTPGEFQLWAEREKLGTVLPLPAGFYNVYTDPARGVLATVTGGGTANAATSVMALGLDPRFDFSRTYWLVAGIAGVDPRDAPTGSAAWAEYVVDGDLAHEIDAREIPATWSSGFLPLDETEPYPKVRKQGFGATVGVVYHLNAALTEWAYQLTKDVELLDNDVMRRNRARFTDPEHANARRAPFVLKGDNLASSTFWHGALLNDWANAWVKYWTEGRGNYVTTAMEDSGTLAALTRLAKAGRVDLSRVMVLRTASNFDRQPPGMTAAESLAEENAGTYSAFIPSVEAAYRVGSKVVHELEAKWDQYEATLPP